MRAGLLLLTAIVTAAPLRAQTAGGFGSDCANAGTAARDLCFNVTEAARILEARTAIAASGGNPVPGTASTLGMRIASQPRLSLAVRLTGVPVRLPGLERSQTESELGFTTVSFSADLAIGLYGGVTVAPTVGGFGSVDLLASVGQLRLPVSDGLVGNVTSWSGGARLGLLRESFTAPGVSLSAMYRRLSSVGYGDQGLTEGESWFRLDDVSGWSVRATASKRVLGFGLTAGAGRDHYSADAAGRVRDATATGSVLSLRAAELRSARTTFFGNAAVTFVILHAAAELGWQSGASEKAALPTTGRLERAGLYGSLALRVVI